MMCPHCGAPTPVHNRFCGRCGAYMAAAPFDATGGETTRPWQTYPAGVGARATVTASPYGDDGDRDAHAYLQPPQFAPPSPPPYGPGPYNVVTPVRDTLVGFGPRFLASLLDGVVLAVVLAVPGLILGAVLAALHASALGGILQSVAVLGYYVYCWSTTGQTVGMKPFHMRVARADGRPLSWGTGWFRWGVLR